MAAELTTPHLFTRFSAGVRAAGPVVLGYGPIGLAFGVLARTAGMSFAEIGLMSLLVYAGSAQFIGTSMIAAGSSPLAILSTTFLVNLRHLLMSTALVPSLRHNPAWQNCLLAYGITDETFAVSSALLQGRKAGPAFMAGIHVTAQSAWVIASLAGALAGEMAANSAALGLDFALPAMFIGLLMPNLTGPQRQARIFSGVAAALATAAFLLLMPGSGWAVMLATVVAATVGVMRS